jgi:Fe-coproporphyrin III synthase
LNVSLGQRFGILRNRYTHRLHRVPVVVLMPHSRCNCRCIMCDIWRANARGLQLSESDLDAHMPGLRRMRPSWVVLSGGEPLMHANLFSLCTRLRALGAKITLLSTGILLDKFASSVAEHVDDVIVSLDGSPEIHDEIRNVPRAFERLAAGIGALRAHEPNFPITARCVIQRANFRDLPNILSTAQDLDLDQISFLPADVSSEAFNRLGGWPQERASSVALNTAEAAELEALLSRHAATLRDGYLSGFIAESPEKLARMVTYYRALAGRGEFPEVRCNAPWVSIVVEADGQVRPCFFHRAYGSLRDTTLDALINAPEAVSFRRGLDVKSNQVCQRCVCSLNL